jgi:hypothetical protein
MATVSEIHFPCRRLARASVVRGEWMEAQERLDKVILNRLISKGKVEKKWH